MQLSHKTILITGATSGVGHALVKKLYPNNKIYITARCPEKARVMESEFPLITVFMTNLADVGSINEVAQSMLSAVDHLDILINNAAHQNTPALTDSDFDFHGIQYEITTNFTSICCLTYLLLPLLSKGHDAAILNVNSALGLVPKRSSAIYCATKSALNTFSQSLRYQLADSKIEVLQAFLPLVDTAMTAGRGSSKMTPDNAARLMLVGLEKKIANHAIGKTKLLFFINYLAPFLAKSIMRNS